MSQFSWQSQQTGNGADTKDRPAQRRGQSAEAVNELQYTLHQRLIEELDPSKLEGLESGRAREAGESAARTLIGQEMPGIVGTVRDELVAAVSDEVLGLGPIEALAKDPSISEIMVNDVDQIFYE